MWGFLGNWEGEFPLSCSLIIIYVMNVAHFWFHLGVLPVLQFSIDHNKA